ncbi:hypothetical protein OIU34_17880 [Pararhizobium sp. BT-229]|uniref:hypothetical protein n=1 Tax=Pararhizobium sp. BT-229 TaxID=2986923 RepID=UPI0021F7AD33|nr:hypothetical protein [Pararhizobium sp. BT-229]MCV9963748.1 hypothetical protein [Pararhizobium sp. BT-229]
MTSVPRKTCTIVGSNKGGVGKSMISLMQTMIYDNAGYPLRLVEIDNERKLSALLGSRVDLPLNAFVRISETSRDRHAAESYYNKVYGMMTEADSLIDFGANVTTTFFEWFEQCEMGHFSAEDNIAFRFVACASPDEQAIASALSAVAAAEKALGPTAEYFVVLNDIYGQSGFAPYSENEQYRRVLDLEQQGKVKVIRIDYCDSLLFEHGKAMHLTPVDIIKRADEVAAKVGLDPIATRVHRLKLMRWLGATQEAMNPLLMVYNFEPEAAESDAA